MGVDTSYTVMTIKAPAVVKKKISKSTVMSIFKISHAEPNKRHVTIVFMKGHEVFFSS